MTTKRLSCPSTKWICRIAIVGAGPGGIAAAKELLAESDRFSIDIFEQQASFGGVWNYSGNTRGPVDITQLDPYQPLDEPIWPPDELIGNQIGENARPIFPSPMYEKLETNIPHCIMKHSDAPSLENHQLFPSREVVLRYLEEYAKEINHLVAFQTQVVDVERIAQEGRDGWLVRVKNLRSREISESYYDAVVVANGHYTVPSLPYIKGISEWNKLNAGIISHSRSYRRPKPFEGKKVIIVGNSASGTDIASQIATVCKKPILNSTRSDSPLTYAAEYKETVPEIVEFLGTSYGNRAVRFSNGHVEYNIDAILFCTGYLYSMPFLTSISPKLITTGERVQHLYKHIFYIPDPTLAFIGLPSKIIPFRTFESQSAVVARVWSRRLPLPSQSEMISWEESVIAANGDGKGFHVFSTPQDLEYHNELAAWASTAQGNLDGIPPNWTDKEAWLRANFPAIKKAFADKGEARHVVRSVEELGFDYDARLVA